MNKEVYPVIVYEYDRLSVGNPLNKEDFAELRSFILKQEEEGVNASVPFDRMKTEDAAVCMKLSASKYGQEILTVQNYVGTILLSSGTTVEILPKLFREGENKDPDRARTFVVEMLEACNVIAKSFQNADLEKLKNMPIFEIYIRIFLNEVFSLYQKGLKSGYEEKQENESFLKGKLLFSQHIKHNFAHAERFFVAYDEFTVNRPENRLIKTTLAFLKRITKADTSKRDLRRLTMIFEEVETSVHVESDIQKCTGGRNMQEYETVLSLCKIFLRGYSFSIYAGKHNTVALLFPMEKLFEGYVAKKLQENLTGWTVTAQYRGKYLFDTPKMFLLKPDIYVEKDGTVVLLDTKWKLLSQNEKNYGISQADMYQMYAYHKRYKNVKGVILLYPSLGGEDSGCFQSWAIKDDDVNVHADFVPLNAANEKGQLNVKKLVEHIEEIDKKQQDAFKNVSF